MIAEIIFAPAAHRGLSRLDRQVAGRILQAVQRYATTGQGDVRRLRGSEGELRLA